MTNKTAKEMTISLNLDESSHRFPETAKSLLAPFCPQDLPFHPSSSSDLDRAQNSQKKFRCWSIENPVNKTLQKSVVVSLAPGEAQGFVIALQTPMSASCADLLAKLVLTHIPDEAEQTQRTIVEKRIGNCNPKVESRRLAIQRKMDVLLCGKLQNPVVQCLKSITTVNDIPVIPLAAKLGQEV